MRRRESQRQVICQSGPLPATRDAGRPHRYPVRLRRVPSLSARPHLDDAAPATQTIVGIATASLLAILKQRRDELGCSMEVIDEVAGLPQRYLSKLFCSIPMKHLGPVSLGPTLGALGLQLVVTVDQAQFDRIKARLTPRASPAFRRKHWHPNSREQLRGNSEWGRVMRARATLLLSPKTRQRIAREAARARWAKCQAGRPGRQGPASAG